jgi:uncharacterized protein YdaU (DUF1376 family)
MGKDPAFLFYPGDWMMGTLSYTLEEKGAYMELLILQFNRDDFLESEALAVLRGRNDLWERIKEKFILNDDKYYNERLKEEKGKRVKFVESRRKSRLKSDEDNVRIYIVRDNVRNNYKIGSSVNPLRRFQELKNQKKPAIMPDIQGERDISLIWYSDIVKRNIESKLHDKYISKHIEGEWFSLNKEDLNEIISIYKGTIVERTLHRTENENEIRDLDSNENEKLNLEERKKQFHQSLKEFYTQDNKSHIKDQRMDKTI